MLVSLGLSRSTGRVVGRQPVSCCLQSNMASSWSARSSNMLPMSSRMVRADLTVLDLLE